MTEPLTGRGEGIDQLAALQPEISEREREAVREAQREAAEEARQERDLRDRYGAAEREESA